MNSTKPGELPDVTPREVPAVARSASDADTDPGEGPRQREEAETREHVARTRPEGIRARARPVPVVGADEVTDPDAPREGVPTRPQDVIAIRRR